MLNYILSLYLIIGSEHNGDDLPKNYKKETMFDMYDPHNNEICTKYFDQQKWIYLCS